jgi:Toprim domain/CHC2 zinc finger
MMRQLAHNVLVSDVPMANAVARLGLQLRRQSRELVGPCPRCGGRDRFAINVGKQVWNCRGCSRGGDTIELVRHVRDCSFREAVAFLDCRAVPPSRPFVPRSNRTRPTTVDDRAALDYAGKIWYEANPLGPEAIEYFNRRCIDIDAVPNHGGLRWHPRCPWEGGTTPCVVGRYTTVLDNHQRGVWRRPIDGSKPKALGPTAGCVIRLWADDAVETGLVLGEGVETTLAAATHMKHKGTLLQPAWAAGSAGGMARFPVLPGVQALTLLVDNDESGTGQRAAHECAARWASVECEVTLFKPNTANTDFNDVVLS